MTSRDLRNIHTTRSSLRDTILFNALALKVLLYFYLLIEKLLVATSKFGLYSQGDRSGLSKPKHNASDSVVTNPVGEDECETG